MWFRHRAWIPVTWLLSAANVASVWLAAQAAEPAHATLHAALGAALALGAARLGARRRVALAEALSTGPVPVRGEAEVEAMQSRVLELEERLDFAERLLARQREP
ncbi:MAG: hypothetical protein MUC69_06680, partial [Gemmatimonadales bacterium]|nr:hypothetical protein [Gemmatimonadales bacterium]